MNYPESTIIIYLILLLIGIAIGFLIGVFTALFFFKNEVSLNVKTISSNLSAFGYSGIWVYWHLQAAQGNWLAVPAMADFMGSIAIGFVLGVDLTILMEKLPNLTRKK